MMKKVIVKNRPWQKICTIRFLFIVLITLCLIPFTVQETLSLSNDKPIAVIDGSGNVPLGQQLYLNGNLSSDPNGDSLSYRWTLVSKPEGSIVVGGSRTDAAFSATPDVAGEYEIELIVNDGQLDSDPAYKTIRVIRKR
jgi:hypothetical protein